jgi:hypothetical protein
MLGERFDAFVKESPVAVMTAATLERVFEAARLDRVFEEHAVKGYAKELAFSACVEMMADVVFGAAKTVKNYYQSHPDRLGVTLRAVYDKLTRLEPAVAAGLVSHAAHEVLPVLQAMPEAPGPWLEGLRMRVVDGNHLSGTEHRLGELRRTRQAALPGQALVVYDPRFDLIEAVIPCEDAYAQERALLPEVLSRVEADDCLLADRNFCTVGFLFGVADRGACFVIRQHRLLPFVPTGPRVPAGTDERGRTVFEEPGYVDDPETGRRLLLRRITVALETPAEDGQNELRVVTNLPVERADAVQVAGLYRGRWTVESAFQRLARDLRSELDTLGYPRAALFGFCVAAATYNAVACVKGAIRAAQGEAFVTEELSSYYVAEEVGRVTPGMRIALPDPAWAPFRTMPPEVFAATLVDMARGMDRRKYRKQKRGPKKPVPKKRSGKGSPHVSTARVLAQRQYSKQ